MRVDLQIQVLPAGGETTLFKQFFSNWKDKDQTTGPSKAYTIGKIAQVKQIPFDASTLHNNQAMAAQHNMVDDGSGKVQVTCAFSSFVLELGKSLIKTSDRIDHETRNHFLCCVCQMTRLFKTKKEICLNMEYGGMKI